ncbi:Protein phosphatase methylesterase 1 [Camellia lanceoleosa]|uniref:Protein phosphatase methylesterase 1 n=1 Tax=Camellia lanceoleosa TaxID=1840588 RepID=A0ACC0GW55_9ERIC|nr:Protein phosphatase methylesterase 1 [Camellia lanceoleosa]
MDSSSNSSTMASLPEEEEEQQHTKQPNILLPFPLFLFALLFRLLHKNTHLWIGWAILTKKMIFTFQIRMMFFTFIKQDQMDQLFFVCMEVVILGFHLHWQLVNKEKSRVVAMDLRGHGNHPENELDLSIETLCNDVIAVLKTMYAILPCVEIAVLNVLKGLGARAWRLNVIHIAAKKELSRLCGLIVVDVVEVWFLTEKPSEALAYISLLSG